MGLMILVFFLLFASLSDLLLAVDFSSSINSYKLKKITFTENFRFLTHSNERIDEIISFLPFFFFFYLLFSSVFPLFELLPLLVF